MRGDWQETARTLKPFIRVVDFLLPNGYAYAVSAAMIIDYERYRSGRALLLVGDWCAVGWLY